MMGTRRTLLTLVAAGVVIITTGLADEQARPANGAGSHAGPRDGSRHRHVSKRRTCRNARSRHLTKRVRQLKRSRKLSRCPAIRRRPKRRRASKSPSGAVVETAPVSVGETPVAPGGNTPAKVLAAPVNTTQPRILGTLSVAETLAANSGTWSGGPTSYTYRWLECDSTGKGCAAIQGAEGPSYTLVDANVGHTLRVAIRASNAAGSGLAESAASAVVGPAEPNGPLLGSSALQKGIDTDSGGMAEAFEYTAVANGTVHSLWLYVDSANSASSIVVGLYADNSGAPGSLLASATMDSPSRGAWNSAEMAPVTVSSGSRYWLAALAPTGTLALRDVPSGGGPTQNSSFSSLKELPGTWVEGQSWPNSPASFYASAATVAPPPAPVSTALPTIAGGAVEGDTMTAGQGGWLNSPTSYAYQWQDCDFLGLNCSNIVGSNSASHALGASDVDHTLRVVVTASNSSGSTLASSEPSEIVTAVAPPSVAPSNAIPPAISGTVAVGQVLSGTSGAWTGGPTSYVYQWQDCDASGANCTDLSAASNPTYSVVASDVGHTIRLVVTAANASGSAAQSSSPTVAVPGSGLGEVCTETLTTASNVSAALANAKPGSTVCLSAGEYAQIKLNNINPGDYVTLESSPGETATVAGAQVTNSSFLRFKGLRMTAGFNMYDTGGVASHDYQFVGNTIGNTAYGIVIDGNSAPIYNVLIQGNYMHDLDFPGSSCTSPGPGYAGGQAVTIYDGDGVTVSHNTFRSISWHYIQGGGTARGMIVDHNLFEGPIPADRLNCTHLNVWQIWSGGSNDTFSNNIVRGSPGSPAAVTPIMFETGPGGGTCADSMSNTTITNNLFYDDATAYSIQVLTTTGMTVTNNTVIGSEYGVWVGRSDTCGAGSTYNVSRNVIVENRGGSQNLAMGECRSGCVFDYNVTQDSSAKANGAEHYVIGWSPSFANTTSYEPVGLPFTAGYQGGGGP